MNGQNIIKIPTSLLDIVDVSIFDDKYDVIFENEIDRIFIYRNDIFELKHFIQRKEGEIIGAGSAEQLKSRLESIKTQINELVFRMSTGGISNTRAQTELDAIKAEMVVLTKQNDALQKQNQINITVNGAIDPEGTARTIVDTLNNSTYRGGGGGAGSLVMQ
jgi:hypothetical protein